MFPEHRTLCLATPPLTGSHLASFRLEFVSSPECGRRLLASFTLLYQCPTTWSMLRGMVFAVRMRVRSHAISIQPLPDDIHCTTVAHPSSSMNT